MYSYLKFFQSSVPHAGPGHTQNLYISISSHITRTKTSYTVAHYVAYSLKWMDGVRLSSTFHALPSNTYPYPHNDHLNLADLHQSQEFPTAKIGVDVSTAVHLVAKFLVSIHLILGAVFPVHYSLPFFATRYLC